MHACRSSLSPEDRLAIEKLSQFSMTEVPTDDQIFKIFDEEISERVSFYRNFVVDTKPIYKDSTMNGYGVVLFGS
jgi:hypothetical protein